MFTRRPTTGIVSAKELDGTEDFNPKRKVLK